MLLFSNIKKYDLNINKYFATTDIIHHNNNILLERFYNFNTTSPNYILDLPNYICKIIFPSLLRVSWYKNGLLHREEAPALIVYFSDGRISIETWYKNGKEHREEGPALIEYFNDGRIQREEYWVNGKEIM